MFSFFDDICIFGQNWEELMLNLIEILELLKAAGLTLNLKKCEFGKRKVEYLIRLRYWRGENKTR